MMIITELPINKIKIDIRLWEVQQEHIEPIVASIKQVGLINPITVLEDNGEYTLVTGEHRLRAYMQLNKETIPAHIFVREYEDIELDKAKCVLREVDENIIRRSSDRFEEGYMLYQRKIAYGKLNPEITDENLNNNQRLGADTKEIPKSFMQDTMEKTGIKERTINERVQIGSRINEEDGRRADDLDVSMVILRTIIRGEDTEEVKEGSKIHIDTIEELVSSFDSTKKRNGFYIKCIDKFRNEKGHQYNIVNPVEFANELKSKIYEEYLPEYFDPKVEEKQPDADALIEEPQCTYEKTDNILICDTVYSKQFPEVCNRFMTIHVNNESEFEIVNKVISTFGQEVKIAIICLNAIIFSKYINN
ncbi:ParB N-terminal domain-containing protein [Clostridium gasigenes]|uniref:ParB N-terminal domain-containing protein n=1 Tax=Clostridium gasigenes TaxID=94869 RepID=A0A7X0SFH7_9CLOT|nr:ParB N-terminal domain-containing protein [Clostridium gasigenes]MBB6715372.1 ParB N-terminal domain-containing protein [Clostridium gasigenes]